MKASSAIEPLEARIAPASAFVTYTDIDGDLVKITAAKAGPTAPTLDAADLAFVGGGANGQLAKLTVSDLSFEDASITFAVTKQPGGDGVAHVGAIDGTARALGTVTVKGDLGDINCGASVTGETALESLSVASMGLFGLATQGGVGNLVSIIDGALGTLSVAGDLKGVRIEVASDGTIGSVTIGGSLIGGSTAVRGRIDSEGDMGPVKIGGNLEGGSADSAGVIHSGGKLASVTIGGSVLGSAGLESGKIVSELDLGPVKIAHDLAGGFGVESGAIESGGKLTSVKIGGSILGSAGASSGRIFSAGDLGPVTVAHDVKGGAGDESGKIDAGGKLSAVTIGGALLGGSGDQNTFTDPGGHDHDGQLFAVGDIGVVKIGHNLQGASGEFTAAISSESGKIGGVTVGGSLLGGEGGDSARIHAPKEIGPVTVGHDWRGGAGAGSAFLRTNADLASVTIGGSLVGGAGADSGVFGAEADIGPVKIGHDVRGGSGLGSGLVAVGSTGATIGGSVIGGAGAQSGGVSGVDAGPIKIGHDLVGGSITSGSLAGSGFIRGGHFDSITIGGSIINGVDASSGGGLTENASIGAYVDIGSITVKGSLVGNVSHDGDTFVIISAGGQLSSGATSDVAIGKITIGGRVEFAQIFAGYWPSLAQRNADAQIGSVKVGGDWASSSIVAGARNLGADNQPGGTDVNADNVNFGDSHDAKIDELAATGQPESATITSKIGSITIAGQVFGTPDAFSNFVSGFGFVSEEIGALKVGGVTVALAPDEGDGRIIGRMDNMKLHEIGAPITAIAPVPVASATLVNPNTVTYDDIDGDHVTVKLSKPLLDDTNVKTVFKFDTGTVGDGVPAWQQLQLIDLTALATAGLDVTVTVKRGAGDGLADIGFIDSTGLDAGKVTIPGDLGQIDAGDPSPGGTGLKSLTVRTLGRFDVDTQPPMGGTFIPSLTSMIDGHLGALTVKQDVAGASVTVTGDLGNVTIGGSLFGPATSTSGTGEIAAAGMGVVKIGRNVEGGADDDSGRIVAHGKVSSVTVGGSLIGRRAVGSGAIVAELQAPATGPIKIGHNVLGGIGGSSGYIEGRTLSNVTVGGSLVGGLGGFSGRIRSTDTGIGAVKIGHNVYGGAKDQSGTIDSNGPLASVDIGGSVIGGLGNEDTFTDGNNVTHAGQIFAVGDLGAVSIGHDVHGAGGNSSGAIGSNGTFASLAIGGSLVGGAGLNSARISSASDLGPIKIAHDLAGGAGDESAKIATFGKIGDIAIGGSFIGGGGSYGTAMLTLLGQIFGLEGIGAVKIGHDLHGGSGRYSGAIESGTTVGGPVSALAGLVVGGSFVGGTAGNTGEISATGNVGAVKIGHDLRGGSIPDPAPTLNGTGFIRSEGRIGDVTIGGSIVAGTDTSGSGELTRNASIRAGDDLGAIKVKGSLVGQSRFGDVTPVIISARGQESPAATDVAIKSLTVGGRVEHANILAGYDTSLTPMNANAQIGAVKVGRDWIASNLIAGVQNDAGTPSTTDDNINFGDGHDDFIGGANTTIAKIASITIKGLAVGTDDPADDHFGFVTHTIGSFKLTGSTIPVPPPSTVPLSPLTASDVTIVTIGT